MTRCPNCGRSLLGLRADHPEICNVAEGKLPVPRITAIDQIRSRPPEAVPIQLEKPARVANLN